MERRALEEGGRDGGFLRGSPEARRSRDRSLTVQGRGLSPARRRNPEQAEWMRILMGVKQRLEGIKPKSTVEPLYQLVVSLVSKDIDNVLKWDVESGWGQINGFLKSSRKSFDNIRKVLLAARVSGAESLYSVFEALVKGLTFKDEEWMAASSAAKRNKFMVELLHRTGGLLKSLDRGDYFKNVLGPDTPAAMRSLCGVLQGASESPPLDSDDHSSGRDWRERLVAVMGVVDRMHAPSTIAEWVLSSVRHSMHESVKLINMMDLNDDETWGNVLTLLNDRLSVFGHFSQFSTFLDANLVSVFEALRKALESKLLKMKRWMEISGEDDRNRKIDAILKALGNSINAISDEILNSIHNATQMRQIAALLRDSPPDE